MKIFKYLLFNCLFLISSDSLCAFANPDAPAPVPHVLDRKEVKDIKLGDIAVIKYIVEKKGVNAVDESGNPVLFIALDMDSIEDVDNKILKAKLDAAKYLIVEKNANIECVNKFGLTPFLIAVNKFMPNVSPFGADRMVDYAFNKLRFEFIEFLIDRKVNLSASDIVCCKNEDDFLLCDRSNFLMMAIDNGDKELVEFLFSLGVITEQMYQEAVKFYQKEYRDKAGSAASKEAAARSLMQSIAVTVKNPGSAGEATAAATHLGSEGAAEAEARAAQKRAPVLDQRREDLLGIIRVYLNYREGRLFNIVNQNLIGSDGSQVPDVAKIVTSYVAKGL